MTREETLDTAKQMVCGHREQEYGSPEDNFKRIAALWSNYKGITFDAGDVAMMMALLKIARIQSGNATKDSFIDLAGYAACGAEIMIQEGPEELTQNMYANGELVMTVTKSVEEEKRCCNCEYDLLRPDDLEFHVHCGLCTVGGSKWEPKVKKVPLCEQIEDVDEKQCCDCKYVKANRVDKCLNCVANRHMNFTPKVKTEDKKCSNCEYNQYTLDDIREIHCKECIVYSNFKLKETKNQNKKGNK